MKTYENVMDIAELRDYAILNFNNIKIPTDDAYFGNIDPENVQEVSDYISNIFYYTIRDREYQEFHRLEMYAAYEADLLDDYKDGYRDDPEYSESEKYHSRCQYYLSLILLFCMKEHNIDLMYITREHNLKSE